MEIGVVKEHGCCHLHLADSMQQLVAGWIIESPLFEGQGFGMVRLSRWASIGSYTSSKYISHFNETVPIKNMPQTIHPRKSSIENTLNCDAFKDWILSLWNTYFLEVMQNLRGVTHGVSLRGVRQPAVSGRTFVTERYWCKENRTLYLQVFSGNDKVLADINHNLIEHTTTFL